MRARRAVPAGGLRLRELHGIADAGGTCELVYDLERTMVMEVPQPLRAGVRSALGGGGWAPDVESWLREEDLLTGEPERSAPPAADPALPRVADFSIDMSGACNLACNYCFENDIGSRIGPMADATAMKALDLAFRAAAGAPRVTLHFGSGEPLLRMDLLRRVVAEGSRRAAGSGQQIAFELTTNASLVTEEIAAFLARHPFDVKVSCDGPELLHDANRPYHDGSGSYSDVLQGLRLLIDALPRGVGVNAVMTHGMRVRELWAWAREIGARNLIAVKLGTFSDGADRLRLGEVETFRGDLLEICDDLFADLEAGRWRTDYSAITRHVRRLARGSRLTRYCGVASSFLGIASNGEVYPCFRHLGMPQYALGHVRSAVDDEGRRRFLSREAADVDRRPVCSECWARYQCGGGCYADSAAYADDPGLPQVQHCPFWQTEVEVAVRFYHRLREADPAHLITLLGGNMDEVLHTLGLDRPV